MPLTTDLNEREIERMSSEARKVSAMFLDLSQHVEENDGIKIVIDLLMIQGAGPKLVNEISEVLKGALGVGGEGDGG